MALRKLCVLVALLLLPGLAVGGSEKQAVRKPITVVKDRAEFIKELAAKGHKAKGGIAKSKTEDDDARHK